MKKMESVKEEEEEGEEATGGGRTMTGITFQLNEQIHYIYTMPERKGFFTNDLTAINYKNCAVIGYN